MQARDRATSSPSSRRKSTRQQQAARESEIAQLRAKRDDLRAAQGRVAADATARRDQARAAVQGKRDALRAQVEAARNSLKELEASLLPRVDDFRQKALAASDFQKQKDDPLSRMTAYQELKNDPKDGETITLFSWMTKFLIIFLEIVPVVAKLFFSPPSVYAARIQAEVERERRRIQRELDQAVDARKPRSRSAWPRSRRPSGGRRRRRSSASPNSLQKVSKAPIENRIIPAEEESGPSLVPPRARSASRRSRAEASTARIAAARDLEAERRREMERLIDEEMVKQAGVARRRSAAGRCRRRA